ncbi:hypothetical protein [Caulobacter segnis]|uniref:Uncharacterized protein n=1 Tax=Caulobacter segnis TaxID=88688 RepID=A0A2W5VBN1_9CAUL|nr:hypothetical protein [Caulobacter segnis]PZR37180.1 MAG: hypothetical protein DI526_01300 [Caulobacter segnis]
MTRKTQTEPVVEADAYYAVVLRERAVLPHQTLAPREEPYEMRGRLLQAVHESVASFEKIG